MKRAAVVLTIAAACTVPDYEFAAPPAPPEDAGPDVQVQDSGPVDAGADVSPAYDAAPIPVLAMPSTDDFAADCAAFTFADMGSALLDDGDASRHCVMFLHNSPYKRPWSDARTACETITRGSKKAHLAIFPNMTKATNLVAKSAVFPPTLATWIGLELTGENPTDLASWTWLGGASTAAFNGWAPGHPAGARCAAWAGASAAQWTDADCATLKGLLCEMDE